MEKNENDIYIDKIPLYNRYSLENFNILKRFGFLIDEIELIIYKPNSKNWFIKKMVGTPYMYNFPNDKPKFNPHFLILYKNVKVMNIEVFICRISTHYKVNFEKWVIEAIDDSENMWKLFNDVILPINILYEIDKFLL